MKAVIFDLNGIFILSPKLSERFEKDFGVPSATFLPALSEIMNKVRAPGADRAFSYWEPYLKQWSVQMSEQEFWHYWFKAETPSLEMIEYARELRAQGLHVFLLSNNFKERAEYYGHYPWLRDTISKAYFSWQTGAIKPDIRAWQIILDEHGLATDECVYFDDQQKNIDAAKSIGMEAFLFSSIEDAKSRVAARM